MHNNNNTAFPLHIIVDEKRYPILTSYRAVFYWFKLMDCPYLEFEEKFYGTLDIFLINDIPSDLIESYKQIINFLSCNSNNNHNKDVEKSIDFEKDYIHLWGAFINQYNIDLNKDLTMHWWEFKARFNDLSDKTFLKQIIQIRIMDVPDQSNIKYYHEIINLKSQYAL